MLGLLLIIKSQCTTYHVADWGKANGADDCWILNTTTALYASELDLTLCTISSPIPLGCNRFAYAPKSFTCYVSVGQALNNMPPE